MSFVTTGLGNSAVNGNLLKDVTGMGIEIAQRVPQTYGPLMGWVNDQVKQIKQAWEQRDWRMGAFIGYGMAMTGAVAALAASGVGLPLVILAGAGAVAWSLFKTKPFTF